MIIRGKITQKQIDAGVPADQYACPLNLSLQAKGLAEIVITSKAVKLDHPTRGEDWLGALPVELVLWIDRFDHHQPVEPIAYRLELE